MEEELNHPSHEEHPLSLSRLPKKKDAGIDQKAVICYGCEEQILDPAAYCCFHCDFFLHKRCAQLPRKITHPMHSQHSLDLFWESPYSSGGCQCNACGRACGQLFIYHCSSCNFDLDVSCANLDREINLDSHDHPLLQLTRPATFFCNACHKVGEDASSYLCTSCPFWIHQRCSLLPGTAKHKNHNHPLKMAYSLPPEYRSSKQYCRVCFWMIHPARWVYYCGRCKYFVHVNCVEISEHHPKVQDESACNQNVVKLPSSHAAQELITHFLHKGDESSRSDSGKTNILQETIVKSHEHPLILSEKLQNQDEIYKSNEGEAEVLVCDWCIEPIGLSDLYYACSKCSYFVHLNCHNLPHEMQIPQHPRHPLSLMYTSYAVGYFRCNACRMKSNGCFYLCELCELSICIKCAIASMIPTVAHAADKHLLTPSSNPVICTGCGVRRSNFGFACEDCRVYLCYNCALLPPTTKQRWDKHPLMLRYQQSSVNIPEEFYCVLCEEEIKPNRWMYHCRECDYSLHPRCVPQIGLFRRLKFGRSLTVRDHSHPLTHVPEANYKSFCKDCRKRLDWKRAFECQFCSSFHLCKSCAFERES